MSGRKITVKAIIVAAGEGKRFGGGRPKQFLSIAGKTVLEHSIIPFQKAVDIDEIIVVLPEKYIKIYSKQLKERYKKISQIVAGGRIRPDSVLRGIEAAGDATVYLIHDGVRPLVSAETLRKVVRSALRYGAAIPALRIHDTVKEVDAKGFVKRTLEREKLCRAQTPQGFRNQVLKDSMDHVPRKVRRVTDEAMLAELSGFHVKVIDGDVKNLKITTLHDFNRVKMLIEEDRMAFQK